MFKIVPSQTFGKSIKKLAKKYSSIVDDYEAFVLSLQTYFLAPKKGDMVGKNTYKLRMSIESKNAGKSGSTRVLICAIIKNKKLLLLDIYDKSDISTVTDNELNALIKKAIAEDNS